MAEEEVIKEMEMLKNLKELEEFRLNLENWQKKLEISSEGWKKIFAIIEKMINIKSLEININREDKNW